MADKFFEPEISRSLKRASNLIAFPVAIECKKETGTSFAFNRVEDHQLQALADFMFLPFHHKMRVSASVGGKSRFQLKTGFDFIACPSGEAFILVNFRATKKAGGKAIPKGTNRCFALPVTQFVNEKDKMEKTEGRKSFPYSWFEKNALELERISWKEEDKTVYGWDLAPLWH